MPRTIPRFLVKGALGLTDFLDRHPLLVRQVLRRISNAPLVRRYLWVSFRGFMGSSAFDCHVVDAERGRVVFGGVKEIFYPSCLTRHLRETLEKEVGPERADEALRRMAREAVYQEVKFGLEGNWFPKGFLGFLDVPSPVDTLRADPELMRLFKKGMDLVNRFIHDEGGYGRVELDLSSQPMRSYITNSLSARTVGTSDRPVCSSSCGMTEGALENLFKEPVRVREVECAAMGAPRCTFEIVREAESREAAGRGGPAR